MPPRLADRLNRVRQRHFVGRASELSLFRTAITARELPFHVLYVCGPDGIGKTTLLGEYLTICQQQGIAAYLLDAHHTEPTPKAFLTLLNSAVQSNESVTALEVLEHTTERRVLLIDTYEAISPLEDWLRNLIIAQLSEQVMVVIACRYPPKLAWRADPGWRNLLRIVPLHNLSKEESRRYLTLRNIPSEQYPAILEFAHGFPLALSLIAELFVQDRQADFRPEFAPDVIKTLLEQLIQETPGPTHRAALEVCGLVRLTTEPLLAELLEIPDAHELFTWLRDLSFVESGALGIFPHEAIREALIADLRWRNPEGHAQLHRRAQAYYSKRLHQTPPQQQQRILADYIYLHRNNMFLRPYFDWEGQGSLTVGVARSDDVPALVAMVHAHEGEASARLFGDWVERQPDNLLVVRDHHDTPLGCMFQLALTRTTPEERQTDPAVQAAWEYLQHSAPLRSGEIATYFRFWMARDQHQGISHVQSILFIHMVRHYLTTAGLAFSFLPCLQPNLWNVAFEYADLARTPAADFTVANQHFSVFSHDWRTTPPLAWLKLLGEREIASDVRSLTPTTRPTVLVLNEQDFGEAVRNALRDLARADLLQQNPLAQSRLVLSRAQATAANNERATTLRNLLLETCTALQASPRDLKAYRAVYHTYIQPAATQEQAAELLALPFSTFRRHLKSGVDLLTDLLWQQELQGLAGDSDPSS
jgi:hypothetical protein